MKFILPFSIICLLINLSVNLYAQIPDAPNRYDLDGNKSGKWVIYFDADWNPTEYKNDAEFYRILFYENGKPIGKVIDYYKSGIPQMETYLISDNPEIKEGHTIFYFETGVKNSEGNYTNNHKEGEWKYYSEEGSFDYTVEYFEGYRKDWNGYRNYANKQMENGQYKKAEYYFKLALASVLENFGEDHPNASMVYADYGLFCTYMEMYSFALELMNKSLEIDTKNKMTNTIEHSILLGNIAFLFSRTGKYSLAEQYYIKALALLKSVSGENNEDYASALNNYGNLDLTLGRYESAAKKFQKAYEILKNASEINYYALAIILNNLTTANSFLQLYDQVIEQKKEVLKYLELSIGKENEFYVISLNNLALSYQNLKKLDLAEQYFLQGLKIIEDIGRINSESYLVLTGNLATLYSDLNNFNEAEKYHLITISKMKELYGTRLKEYVAAVFNYAYDLEKMKRYDEVEKLDDEAFGILLERIENYFPALSDNEKAKYWTSIESNFNAFYQYAIKRAKERPELLGKMYNYRIATKALLLNSSQKVRTRIQESGNPELINTYNEWISAREEISKLYSMTKQEVVDAGYNIDSLEMKINSLEKSLSRMSKSFANEFTEKSTNWLEIRNNLKNGEASVEIFALEKFDEGWTGEYFYAALIITTSTANPELIIIDNADNIEKKYLKAYSNWIKFGYEDYNLYEKFFGKIAGKLTGISKLYISLDGVYNQINLNSLYDDESEEYLIDKYDVHILTNTKELTTKNKEKTVGQKSGILFGFPKYALEENPVQESKYAFTQEITSVDLDSTEIKRAGIGELKNTKIEVEKIEKKLKSAGWQTKSFLEKDATEENLKLINSPGVLHIATHGFFLEDKKLKGGTDFLSGMEFEKAVENPLLRSGLLFAGAQNSINDKSFHLNDGSNGIVTAFEAMNLSLDETELVVLSACQTGLGEIINGEGVYGLQRSFLVAGADAVIMSLWKVPDKQTMFLMEKFYDNWLAGMDKSPALKKAQIDLREEYPDPGDWGAFILIGD